MNKQIGIIGIILIFLAIALSGCNGPSVDEDKEGNKSPTCSLSAAPSTGNVPLIVTFSMTATDTDGSISSWELDTNDDGVSEYSGSSNPPTTMEHLYENLGTYTAKLTVTDNNNATCTTTKIIIVSVEFNTPPTCTLNAVPNTGNVPLTVTFMMIATDADGSISSWELDTNDDGVSEYSGSSNPPTTMEHLYENLGTYTAKLTVTDNNNATCTTTKIIIVS